MANAGNADRTTLNSLTENLDVGDVANPALRLAYFQYMTDLSDANWTYLAGLVANGTLSPYPAFMSRQAIINGNFDVPSRGTSFTNPVSASYTLDRWKLSYSADGGTLPTNVVHSQQAITPGDIAGASSFYRIAPDSAGSAYGVNAAYDIRQYIEMGTRYLCGNGKKITVSFWARSSIANKKISVTAQQGYGGGGAPSSTEILVGTTFSLTSSWQKFTYTFTTNTLAGKTFGTNNDDYLVIQIAAMWGSSWATTRIGTSVAETFVGAGNIDIAQVQVNAGDVALPFQPINPANEERKCLRYNRKIKSQSTSALAVFGFGYAISTTQAKIFIPFPVRMRTTPTLTTSGTFRLTDGASALAVTGISIDSNTVSLDGLILTITVASGLTAGDGVGLQAENNVNFYLNFDADL